jgi:hypothetical protein
MTHKILLAFCFGLLFVLFFVAGYSLGKDKQYAVGAILYTKRLPLENFKTSDGRGFEIRRKLIEIPKAYGDLLSSHYNKSDLLLWFKDKKGDLRDVAIPNPRQYQGLIISRF